MFQVTAMHCNQLQHPTTHCNIPQQTATRCHTDFLPRHYGRLDPYFPSHSHCNTLQHIHTLLHTAKQMLDLAILAGRTHVSFRCNTLQHTATHCNALQHIATHCSTDFGPRHSDRSDPCFLSLQHTATHCNTLQHTSNKDELPRHSGRLDPCCPLVPGGL